MIFPRFIKNLFPIVNYLLTYGKAKYMHLLKHVLIGQLPMYIYLINQILFQNFVYRISI